MCGGSPLTPGRPFGDVLMRRSLQLTTALALVL